MCRDLSYELVGAVMVRPEHFYCIVKVDNGFTVLDDLKDSSASYQCFSGAIRNDFHFLQDHHLTSPNHDGIHVLLYASQIDSLPEGHSLTVIESGKSFKNECQLGVSAKQYRETDTGSTKVKRNYRKLTQIEALSAQQRTMATSKIGRERLCLQFPESAVSKKPTQIEVLSAQKITKIHAEAEKLSETDTNHRRLHPKPNSRRRPTCTDVLSAKEINVETDTEAKTPKINRDRMAQHNQTQKSAVCRKLIQDGEKSGKGCITLLGQDMPCREKSGKVFIECKHFFEFSGLRKNINKEGYKFIDSILKNDRLETSDEFIFSGKKLRTFISLEAVRSVINGRIQVGIDSVALLHDIEKALCSDGLQIPDRASLRQEEYHVGDYYPSGTISLDGREIKYKLSCVTSKEMNLLCEDIFPLLKLGRHIKEKGYEFIYKRLEKNDLDPKSCFIRKGHIPVYVSLKAITVIIDSTLVPKEVKQLKTCLMEVFAQDVATGRTIKKQMTTPRRKKFLSPVTVFSSPKTTPLTALKTKRKTLNWKRNVVHKRRKTNALKSALKAVCAEHFNGNKNSLLDSLSLLTKCSNQKVREPNTSFDGYFSFDDIVYLLQKAQGKKTVTGTRNLLEQLVHAHAKDVFNLLPAELVYLQENFSGTRLFEELRKRLPGIIPSQRVERSIKKELKKDFQAVLLSKRTPSGWQIDPSRLLEVLSFKYHRISGPKHWKVYGDGREIGGRQSAFLTISVLNDEAFFIDESFQNPNNIYPLNIFYESDSRDNLEENLGFPCRADAVFSKMDNDVFYLSGDEMFLIKMLDASGELGPTTETGWNTVFIRSVTRIVKVKRHPLG